MAAALHDISVDIGARRRGLRARSDSRALSRLGLPLVRRLFGDYCSVSIMALQWQIFSNMSPTGTVASPFCKGITVTLP